MKTIYKLILKSYAGPMVLTFVIVMFVLVMQFIWLWINEIAGKGLGTAIIIEFIVNISITLIPQALPLATLLAAIMTMGNLGENYELLAMKSAGMSLPRILSPILVLVCVVSVGSFILSDRVSPYYQKKMLTMLSDIRSQKQSLEFQDGIFFNGIDNVSIRVGRQDDETQLLTDVLIYDTRNPSQMQTTVADSGYISLSDDRKYLMITLYNGEMFEEYRPSNATDWMANSTLSHRIFDLQSLILETPGFDFSSSDGSLYENDSRTKNIRELRLGMDSLAVLNQESLDESFRQLARQYMFPRDTALFMPRDSLRAAGLADRKTVNVDDSVAVMDLDHKNAVYENALNLARNAASYTRVDESYSKQNLNQLYRYQIEWHRKFSLPFSIIIFFLIGAPLGAIIRKGGLGTPIVISVSFFVIYYIISITGEKMAKEGTLTAASGMWVSAFILLPIAVYLTYKATNDSNLLNAEWYQNKLKKIATFFRKKLWRRKSVY